MGCGPLDEFAADGPTSNEEGTPIGAYDLMIAATAFSGNLTSVTTRR